MSERRVLEIRDIDGFVTKRLHSCGHPVAEARLALGWSQARLARESGMSLLAIQNIEHRSSQPYPATREALARVLGLPVETLFPPAAAAVPRPCRGSGRPVTPEGARLARLRQERGLTISALARRAGLAQPLISRFEREGPGPLLALKTARALARALDIPLDDLFPDSEDGHADADQGQGAGTWASEARTKAA